MDLGLNNTLYTMDLLSVLILVHFLWVFCEKTERLSFPVFERRMKLGSIEMALNSRLHLPTLDK